MTKSLKSLYECRSVTLIRNQRTAGLVPVAGVPPLAHPGPSRARRDPPGGGTSRHALPPAVTPYLIFKVPRPPKKSRKEGMQTGVGGDWFRPVPPKRVRGLIRGVRT